MKNNKIMNFLRMMKTLVWTKSLRRAKFVWYELDLNVSTFDDSMLLTQLGYFGHHTEKALKHHNRKNRGYDKRMKLELLVKEVEKRKLDEPNVINWAKHLMDYFDKDKQIYLEKLDTVEEHQYKNEILECMRARTTTRFWKPLEVDDEIIKNIIEIAMTSAISCNRQSIKFAVLKNKVENMVVGDSNNKSMFSKAPITIFIANDERFFHDLFETSLDVGSVCSSLLLASKAFGLAGTWIYQANYYNDKELRDKCGFTKHDKIYSVITLGYPLDNQEKPPRYKTKFTSL